MIPEFLREKVNVHEGEGTYRRHGLIERWPLSLLCMIWLGFIIEGSNKADRTKKKPYAVRERAVENSPCKTPAIFIIVNSSRQQQYLQV